MKFFVPPGRPGLFEIAWVPFSIGLCFPFGDAFGVLDFFAMFYVIEKFCMWHIKGCCMPPSCSLACGTSRGAACLVGASA